MGGLADGWVAVLAVALRFSAESLYEIFLHALARGRPPAALGHQKARPGLGRAKSPRAASVPVELLGPQTTNQMSGLSADVGIRLLEQRVFCNTDHTFRLSTL